MNDKEFSLDTNFFKHVKVNFVYTFCISNILNRLNNSQLNMDFQPQKNKFLFYTTCMEYGNKIFY